MHACALVKKKHVKPFFSTLLVNFYAAKREINMPDVVQMNNKVKHDRTLKSSTVVFNGGDINKQAMTWKI